MSIKHDSAPWSPLVGNGMRVNWMSEGIAELQAGLFWLHMEHGVNHAEHRLRSAMRMFFAVEDGAW
jgi:hypothetical protein